MTTEYEIKIHLYNVKDKAVLEKIANQVEGILREDCTIGEIQAEVKPRIVELDCFGITDKRAVSPIN